MSVGVLLCLNQLRNQITYSSSSQTDASIILLSICILGVFIPRRYMFYSGNLFFYVVFQREKREKLAKGCGGGETAF